jgi:hypothetical protein
MLKSTNNHSNVDNLLLTCYMNLAGAIEELRSAQKVEQSPEERSSAIERAKHEIGCLTAHFEGALGEIPAD